MHNVAIVQFGSLYQQAVNKCSLYADATHCKVVKELYMYDRALYRSQNDDKL
jgi:hypothetical protein